MSGCGVLRCAFGLSVHPLVSVDILVAWHPVYLYPKGGALFPKPSKLRPEGMEEILAILGSRVRYGRDGGLAVDEQGGLGGTGRSPDQIEAKDGTAHLCLEHRMVLRIPEVQASHVW